MKRKLLVITAYIICCVFIAAGSYGIAEGPNGVSWTLEKGTLTILGDGVLSMNGPWQRNADQVKVLIISDGFTAIDGSISKMKNLSEIDFGQGIVETDWTTFGTLPRLKKLVFSGPVKKFVFSQRIEDVVFENQDSDYVVENNLVLSRDRKVLAYAIGTKQQKVDIPEGVEVIQSFAFAEMKNLSSVTFPSTLKRIEGNVFRNCSRLNSIVFPESLEYLGAFSFLNCKSMKNVTFTGQRIEMEIDRSGPFIGCTGLQEMILPACKGLSQNCFSGCTGLKKVIIGEGTTAIGNNPFSGCKNLVTVFIPDSVKSIDENAFDYSLKRLVLQCHADTWAEGFLRDHGYNYEIVRPVQSIQLSEEELVINKGTAVQLKTEIIPEDATDRNVIWSSSDDSIATVQKGKISARNTGECEIRCDSVDGSGVSAACHVRVIQMIKSINVKKRQLRMNVGDTESIVIDIRPADATELSLSWESTDPDVAVISDDGVIKAVSGGECTVTATTTDGSNKTVSIKISVTADK